MSTLKPLASQGKGKVAAILPDTVTSTRYVEFDAPYITKALTLAGLSSSDIIVQNAQGSDTTQFTDAQSDITNGATVLLVDPLDPGVGARIEAYAKSHGVATIDYDRLTLGGSRSYYVSFDNVLVGKTMGQGMVTCLAALIPNDENAAPIITYLKTHGIKAKTFPTTGQDATLTGLQNILTGYQCGTVYKPIYLEAEGATALAMYLRAGKTPPASLVNGATQDTTSHVSVPSILETPIWVTPANMDSTVIKDKFVPAAQLCTGAAAAGCKAAGIS